MDTDNVVVFTEAKVRALAGISQRQLRYWAEDLALPAIDRQMTARRGVRLYDFDGVLTVLILADLKRKNFSLQYLRQVVDYVAREGLDFAQLRFAVVGSKLHFQRPDGQWQDAHSSQLVADVVLPLEPLRAKVKAASQRDSASVGRFEKRRGDRRRGVRKSGQPTPLAGRQGPPLPFRNNEVPSVDQLGASISIWSVSKSSSGSGRAGPPIHSWARWSACNDRYNVFAICCPS